MSKHLKRKIALIMTLLLIVSGSGMTSRQVKADNRIVAQISEERTGLSEETTGLSEETIHEETSKEAVSEEENVLETTSLEETSVITSEHESIEEETTEEIPEETTEEITTVDYEILQDLYKVKDGVLIEYVGDREDSQITELVIPAQIKSIADNVFENCTYIETVQFEEQSQLLEIGQYAFQNCIALQQIELPVGVKKIGYMAFNQCQALKSLTVPSTVTYANRILGKNPVAETVIFQKGIKKIPDKVLKYAYSVKSVTIPSGVTSIGNNSFLNCTGLESITVPKTVLTIGSSAFEGCTNITLYVYANSTGKAYARENNIKWEYTDSEIMRRAANDAIYRTFMSYVGTTATAKMPLKNLKEYVPQGICNVGKYMVVSMYYKNLSRNSILLVYKRSTGAYVKKIVLPSKDHVGSLTNVKGRLVVGLTNISATDYVAVISEKSLKSTKSGKTIKYDYVKKIAGYADFATYDGTIFWAGHSANSSTARMYGYTVKIKKKKLTFTKKYSYIVPANTQGVIAIKESKYKRTFVFSQSYGRLNNSSLITYSVSIKKTTSLGNAISTKKIPSMSEGIYMKGKYIYIVFESAAGLYCDNPDNTSEIQISDICRMKYSRISKLSD